MGSVTSKAINSSYLAYFEREIIENY